ncbi:asparagine synthetase B [Virgibacillus oceani]
MSAITGIVHFNEQPISTVDCNSLMTSFQRYPADRIDTWEDNRVFLGCHTQWITPESLGESLPFHDYERQLVITADAIIDNREELFDLLQVNKDHRKIMPDSHLILLTYSKWEETAPRYLQGEYSFMIWDERKKKMFGARDFSGARTLYFHQDVSRFVFSTTIEPLFTLPTINKTLNEHWLAEYLAIPTMVEAVDMMGTVYKSVYQLPPAHSITVENGKVSLKRYMTIETQDNLKLNSNKEYEEAFRNVFQKAVKQRIRTHGEVGSHLSGGLDSGSVVSFAAGMLQKENKQLHSFSYVPVDSYKDWTPNYYDADERSFIKETVSHIGNIEDNYLSFGGRDSLTEVDGFIDLMEMPYKFFENTFWLKGINEIASEKGIKVMLNGSRGNHSISWGSMTMTYNYYVKLMKQLRWIRLYQELDAYCRNFRTGKSVMLPFIAKRTFLSLSDTGSEDNKFPVLINPSFAEKTKVFEKLYDCGIDQNGLIINNLTDYRRKYYNQLFAWNKSGVANTKMSLRYAMWDRDPTNDINVIRFCLSVPEKQYVTDGMERSLIRRAMKGFLPEKIRLNQTSRGLQGADVIHRMKGKWKSFLNELHAIDNDNDSSIHSFINKNVFKEALTGIGEEPRPDLIFKDEFKILTRSLILYRFLQQFK